MQTQIAPQNELHTMLMKREKRKKEINCNGLLLFVVVFAHRNAITCNTMFCEHVKHRNVTLWLMPKKFQCKHFHTKLFLLHDEFTMECSFSHPLSQYWMVMARRSDLTLTALAPPSNLNLSVRPLNVIVSGFLNWMCWCNSEIINLITKNSRSFGGWNISIKIARWSNRDKLKSTHKNAYDFKCDEFLMSNRRFVLHFKHSQNLIKIGENRLIHGFKLEPPTSSNEWIKTIEWIDSNIENCAWCIFLIFN